MVFALENYAQDSWISAWTNANWLDDNNVIDIVKLDNYIFILLENKLHQHDSSIGVMTNEYDLINELNMARDGVILFHGHPTAYVHLQLQSHY